MVRQAGELDMEVREATMITTTGQVRELEQDLVTANNGLQRLQREVGGPLAWPPHPRCGPCRAPRCPSPPPPGGSGCPTAPAGPANSPGTRAVYSSILGYFASTFVVARNTSIAEYGFIIPCPRLAVTSIHRAFYIRNEIFRGSLVESSTQGSSPCFQTWRTGRREVAARRWRRGPVVPPALGCRPGAPGASTPASGPTR